MTTETIARESNGACMRCEALPERVSAGRLYLWFPLGHTAAKALGRLRGAGLDARALEDGLVSLPLPEDQADGAAEVLHGLFSPVELADTRALLVPGQREPTLADFHRVSSLGQYLAARRAGWLVELLAAERTTAHFQPIVLAADTSRVFAQEALLRGLASDGSLVAPGRMFGLGREAGLLFQLDLAARRTAIRAAHRNGLDVPVFVNFTPTSVYDPVNCLRSTIGLIDELGLRRENVVFEVIESEQVSDADHLNRVLDHYRAHGFRVALDDVGSGHSGLNMIHRLRPDFVKLDRGLVSGVDGDAYKATVAGKLLEMCRELGVRSIAEGVETPGELAWLREHGADLVQGYLIARPSAAPVTRPARL